jgi:hypothetical protein
MKHRLQSWPPPKYSGYPAGTIPAYRVWADDGQGLRLMKVPGIGDCFSRVVASEAVTKLHRTKRYKRVVMTRIEN